MPRESINYDYRNGPQEDDWRARAACRGMDPNLFFPDDGVGVAAAQLVCMGCPVMKLCLEHALENRIDEGVWGGTSERERRRMQNRYKQARLVGQVAIEF